MKHTSEPWKVEAALDGWDITATNDGAEYVVATCWNVLSRDSDREE